MTAVLDASSLLAFLHDEPGAQRDADTAGLRDDFAQIGVEFVPFTVAQAEIAALLWPRPRASGLSLGDPACLALALERGASIVTADRTWASLDLGLRIEPVR